MGVNKFNAEKYHDPTAYEAIRKIESEAREQPYKPLVFICSPFAGDIESNILRAQGYCRFAVARNTIAIETFGRKIRPPI